MKNKRISRLAEMLDLQKKIIAALQETCGDQDFVRRAALDFAKDKRAVIKRWERHAKKLLADLDASKR